MVQYLVEHGADVNALDAHDCTALCIAAAEGHLEVVKYFIEQVVDVRKEGGAR